MEKRLKTLPGVFIESDGGLGCDSGPYVFWWGEGSEVSLDGDFTIEQLREIANHMSRNTGNED